MGVHYSASGPTDPGAVPAAAATATGSGRSPALTWVAAYFFVRAALGVLVVFVLAVAASSVGNGQSTVPVLFGVLFAVPFIYADYLVGRRLLDRDESARGLGMILCGIGVLLGLLGVVAGSATGLIPGFLDGFVLWFLWDNKELSRR
jgi:hypothetical protein